MLLIPWKYNNHQQVQEGSTVPLVSELESELWLSQESLGSILTAPSEDEGCRTRLMQEELLLLTSLIECTLELILLLEGSCTVNFSNPTTSEATTSIGVSSYPISFAAILQLDFKISSKELDFAILPWACNSNKMRPKGILSLMAASYYLNHKVLKISGHNSTVQAKQVSWETNQQVLSKMDQYTTLRTFLQ